LLLRVAACVLILTTCSDDLANGRAGFLCFLMAVLALSIGAGLFTTFSSSLVALLKISIGVGLHNAPLLITVTTAEICVAMTMTGAGAYSLDALFFGYRRVTLPR